MNNQQGQPVDSEPEASPAQQLGHQLRKGLDRIGFEADKLLRANRIRSEAGRLQEQTDEQIFAIGTKVMEMAERGVALEPELQTLVSQVKRLEAEIGRKKKEIETVSSETWTEPEPPPALRPAPARPALQPPNQRRQAVKHEHASPKSDPAHSQGAEQDANRFCPACKASVRPQAAFCANCGYRLS
ncbi:MAG TPA: zinc ribbon domain-containing protein [Chloroflexia bacterium]|jgi:hypothetical protein